MQNPSRLAGIVTLIIVLALALTAYLLPTERLLLGILWVFLICGVLMIVSVIYMAVAGVINLGQKNKRK